MRTIWNSKDPLVLYLVAETEIERIWIAMFQNRDKAIKVLSKDIPRDICREVTADESRLEDRADTVAKKLMGEYSCDHGNEDSSNCARCLAVVGFELRTGENRNSSVKNTTDALYDEESEF